MHVLSGYAVVLIYIMSRLTVADSSDKPRRRHDVTLGCVVALLFNGFVAWWLDRVYINVWIINIARSGFLPMTSVASVV